MEPALIRVELRRGPNALREQWDKDFSTNAEALATNIATSIAAETFKEIQEELTDAYQSDSPYHSYAWSVSPTHPSFFVKTWENLSDATRQLEPFKTWTNHLVRPGLKAGQFNLVKAQSEYFNKKMIVVCQLAVPKLKEIFKAEMAKPGSDLEFHANIEQRSWSDGCCSGSDSRTVTYSPVIRVQVYPKGFFDQKPSSSASVSRSSANLLLWSVAAILTALCVRILVKRIAKI